MTHPGKDRHIEEEWAKLCECLDLPESDRERMKTAFFFGVAKAVEILMPYIDPSKKPTEMDAKMLVQMGDELAVFINNLPDDPPTLTPKASSS